MHIGAFFTYTKGRCLAEEQVWTVGKQSFQMSILILCGRWMCGPPEAEWLPYGYCGQYISPNISVYYVRREEVFGNRISLPVGDYGVTYCHTQMDTESLEATRILTIQNQPALQLKGSGVIIGFVDSGIALQNPVFRTSDGRTRLIGLWDRPTKAALCRMDFSMGAVMVGKR